MSINKSKYAQVYVKFMDPLSTFEEDQFIQFKEMYLQKLDDPDFDQYVEKCKLITRADGRSDNAFVLYCSAFLSLFIFISGILISKNLNDPLIILPIATSVIFIILFIYFCTYPLMKHAMHSDVWNIALVALEAAYKEKITN